MNDGYAMIMNKMTLELVKSNLRVSGNEFDDVLLPML